MINLIQTLFINVVKSLNMMHQNVSNQNKCSLNLPPVPPKLFPLSSYCINHPRKASSHVLRSGKSGEETPYCQKCSIMLASQGFNVVRLGKKRRRREVEEFVESMLGFEQTLLGRQQQIAQQLLMSQEMGANSLDRLSAYFSQLSLLLELQKHTAYHLVLAHRSIIEAPIRNMQERVAAGLTQIQGMLEDVKGNMEAVVTVEQGIYSAIMGGYREKCQVVEDLIDRCLEPINQYDVYIPSVPAAFHSLAEKITITSPGPRSKVPQKTTLAPSSAHENTSIATIGSFLPASANPQKKQRKTTLYNGAIRAKNEYHIEGGQTAFSFDINTKRNQVAESMPNSYFQQKSSNDDLHANLSRNDYAFTSRAHNDTILNSVEEDELGESSQIRAAALQQMRMRFMEMEKEDEQGVVGEEYSYEEQFDNYIEEKDEEQEGQELDEDKEQCKNGNQDFQNEEEDFEDQNEDFDQDEDEDADEDEERDQMIFE